MHLQGAFRVTGHTLNVLNGNKTELSNMVIYFNNGKLAGTGYYDSGSVDNGPKPTRWAGTYAGDQIQINEIWGDHDDHPFLYNGFIEGHKLWGTYQWPKNQDVGSFEFHLTPAAGYH